MKFTEGAFRNYGYALAEKEFADKTYTWDQWERTKKDKGEAAANAEQKAELAKGKILARRDRGHHAQQVLRGPTSSTSSRR